MNFVVTLDSSTISIIWPITSVTRDGEEVFANQTGNRKPLKSGSKQEHLFLWVVASLAVNPEILPDKIEIPPYLKEAMKNFLKQTRFPAKQCSAFAEGLSITGDSFHVSFRPNTKFSLVERISEETFDAQACQALKRLITGTNSQAAPQTAPRATLLCGEEKRAIQTNDPELPLKKGDPFLIKVEGNQQTECRMLTFYRHNGKVLHDDRAVEMDRNFTDLLPHPEEDGGVRPFLVPEEKCAAFLLLTVSDQEDLSPLIEQLKSAFANVMENSDHGPWYRDDDLDDLSSSDRFQQASHPAAPTGPNLEAFDALCRNWMDDHPGVKCRRIAFPTQK